MTLSELLSKSITIRTRYRFLSIRSLFTFKHNRLWKSAFEMKRKKGMEGIPVFIISYNRLSYIKQIISILETYGITNINIIDNASTYPPLLEFYKTIKYKVFYLKENKGQLAFWKDEVFKEYRNDFYIVTDPDIIPISECPKDFVSVLFDTLEKYPYLSKVGLSLKIDDLPDESKLKDDVIKWEHRYWKHKVKKINGYFADIDTTFALYPPERLSNKSFYRAIRMGYPYQGRHLPWYKTSTELDEEDRYYFEHKTNGWWNVEKGEMTRDENNN